MRVEGFAEMGLRFSRAKTSFSGSLDKHVSIPGIYKDLNYLVS
jgi:hypothetical protein